MTTDSYTDASAFQCLECRSGLTLQGDNLLLCPSCSKSWPVRDGIPRFYEPPYYWGEVSREEAEAMIRDARDGGWRQLVAKKFAKDRDMQISLTDWQRASWLPLLALPEGSVALDIGCGYGAITNSVSRAVSRIYSLEAVTERISFTSIRLQQEGITNVRLVQASALQPPFRDGLFDLIVVNGILEWVGAWVDQGDPRDVQLAFLRGLRRMLKPSGIIMVGIENRVGYDSFRGTIDHSGLSYTSLMPRRVATFYMRNRNFKNYLLEKDRKNLQYRTYTYSEKGFRKLFTESGLPSAVSYWSTPGYNQPYQLIPVENNLPSLHLRGKRYEPTARPKRGWKGLAKRAAITVDSLNRVLCSEFVFLATQQAASPTVPPLWTELRRQFPALPALQKPLLELHTKAFGPKNVILVFEDGSHQVRCILRTTTPGPTGVPEFLHCYRNLTTAHECSSKAGKDSFATPQPLGYAQLGAFHYTAESAVEGASLSHRAFSTKTPAPILQADLPAAVDCAVQVQSVFQSAAAQIAPIEPNWKKIPAEFANDAAMRDALREVAGKPDSDFLQHGDFTIENTFLGGSRPAVIDWEHLARGGPALYDVFSLLISALPAVPCPPGTSADKSWPLQFETAFFGQGEWAQLFAQLIRKAATAMGVPATAIPSQFLECLLYRYHIMNERSGVYGRYHAEFLRIAVRSKANFVCA